MPSTLDTQNLQNSPCKKKPTGCSGEQTLVLEKVGRPPYKRKVFSSSGILLCLRRQFLRSLFTALAVQSYHGQIFAA